MKLQLLAASLLIFIASGCTPACSIGGGTDLSKQSCGSDHTTSSADNKAQECSGHSEVPRSEPTGKRY